MKVAVIYRPKSDHARKVTNFQRDYKRRTGREINLINIDTRDGYATASLYDIVSYPAVMATANDGRLIKLWQREDMPLIDEVSYYNSQG